MGECGVVLIASFVFFAAGLRLWLAARRNYSRAQEIVELIKDKDILRAPDE